MGRSNKAASFAKLNQLIYPVSLDGEDRNYNHLELLSLNRSWDLFDAESPPCVIAFSEKIAICLDREAFEGTLLLIHYGTLFVR